MTVPNKFQSAAEGVIASFESGIGVVEYFIEKGLTVFNEVERGQRAIREDLRERLASDWNLRKKDFDVLIERILAFQFRRENELKQEFRAFLICQNAMAQKLKKAIQLGSLDEVDHCKQEIVQMNKVARENMLLFQKEQDQIRCAFEKLKKQKEELSTRQFKKVMSELEKTLKIEGEVKNETCSRYT